MTLIVPKRPPLMFERSSIGATVNSARIGTPPLGIGQWYEIARAQNWLIGGGAMQLASFGPRIILGGATDAWHTYAWPRPQGFCRLWTFVMEGERIRGAVTTADAPSGQAFDTGANADFGVVRIAEYISNPVAAGEAISVSMTIASDVVAAVIHSASCIEIPIRRVGSNFDPDGIGVHETSCTKWHPIAELDESTPSTTDQTSVTGVQRVASLLETGASAHRRACIFDWFATTGVSLSSSTYTNLFRADPVCQTRKVYAGETYRQVNVAVYAAASASAGNVRLTSAIDSGVTTLNINSSVPAWYTGTLNVACDDFSQTGWERASNTVAIERRATSGNIVVYGVKIGEG